MPNTIKIKNNGTAGAVPSSLEDGELAINRADGLLYYKNTSNAIAAITDTIDGGVPSTPALLLMHFDNSTADSSTYARTVTTSGTATTSATQSKFGGYSAYLDGSTSGRFVAADGGTGSAFSFAGDFTVEAWVYPTAAASYRTIVTRYNGSNNAWVLRFDGTVSALTSLAWYAGSASGAYYNFSATIALNQWHHVAICRSGSSLRAFLNGTQIGSTQTNSSVMTGGAAGCMIGASDQGGFEFPFAGYIDELRIIPQAMYTANFTPSTSAFGQFAAAAGRTQTMKFRGGTAATLAAVNPTPAAREPVYETDNRCLKVGDGTTAYSSLGYVRPYVTATDRLLGRSTAGAGVAEEITCTSFARTVLDDADAATARTTLGVAYGSTAGTVAEGSDPRLALKAWVNFDGTAANSLNGTYTRSGTNVTVTATAHGLIAGTTVYLDFTSGTAADGLFTVTSVSNVNTFQVSHGTSGTTSGNVTLTRQSIRASYNVSSVGDNGTGDYTVNFTTALADALYAALASAGDISWGNRTPISTPTASSVRVFVISGSANAFADSSQVFVAVFR